MVRSVGGAEATAGAAGAAVASAMSATGARSRRRIPTVSSSVLAADESEDLARPEGPAVPRRLGLRGQGRRGLLGRDRAVADRLLGRHPAQVRAEQHVL